MEKLCSLKSLIPGSIVKMPKEYQRSEGELAVALSPRYVAKGSDEVNVDFVRAQGDELVTFSPNSAKDTTILYLSEDEKFKKAMSFAFGAGKLVLPAMPMSSGCDPEIFVEHGDGSIFPAWEYMPNEDVAHSLVKEWMLKPSKYPGYRNSDVAEMNEAYLTEHCAAYWDGAQAEFAPFAKGCLEALHYGIRQGLKSVLDFARLKDKNAKLILRNVIELPPDVLKNAADTFIQFRCSKSLNIYGDSGEGVPNAREYKYRCAGGHIHFGYSRRFTAPGIEQIIRSLDGLLGIAGVCLAAGIDNPERRNTYGRAGEFRLPSYGIEYRVLSNFWLSHPAVAMLVYELARVAVRMGESGIFNLCFNGSEEEIREAINNCDVELARKLINRNKTMWLGMIDKCWSGLPVAEVERMRQAAWHTIQNGIGAVIPKPMDVESNWKLGDDKAINGLCRGQDFSWRSFSKRIKL